MFVPKMYTASNARVNNVKSFPSLSKHPSHSPSHSGKSLSNNVNNSSTEHSDFDERCCDQFAYQCLAYQPVYNPQTQEEWAEHGRNFPQMGKACRRRKMFVERLAIKLRMLAIELPKHPS
jgi:hypothetical protein